MKEYRNNRNVRWKSYALGGCCCVLLFAVLQNLRGVLSGVGVFLSAFSTLFTGAVIAYVLNPLALFFSDKVFKKLKNRKLAWSFGIVVTFIILIVAVALLLIALVPQLTENVEVLMANVDEHSASLLNKAEAFGEPVSSMAQSLTESLSGSDGLVNQLGSSFLGDMSDLVSKAGNIGGKTMNAIIGIIFALYFMFSKDSIKEAFKKLYALVVSPVNVVRSSYLLDKFNDIFAKYVVFQLLDSLIIGTLNFIFMLVTGMPDALLISVVNAFTNLVPTVGPIVGGAIGGVLLLLTKPEAVIPYLLFTVLLQMSDGYLIKPRLFGEALEVPGLIILIFVIVLGKLMGMAGMLLAIPAAGFFVHLYTQWLIPWLELRRDLAEYQKEMSRSTAKARIKAQPDTKSEDT